LVAWIDVAHFDSHDCDLDLMQMVFDLGT